MNFLEKYGIYNINENMLKAALTHTSYTNEHKCEDNYERLEFLGDAVLDLIISDYIFRTRKMDEGEMSKLRSCYVCEVALDKYAEDVGFKKYIRVGQGQMNNINETIVADIFEAIIGCIYLDKGFEVCKKFIHDVTKDYIDNNYNFISDYKTTLQEYVQTDKKSLEYVLVNEYGSAHNKTYEVNVVINNIVYGHGIGKSKKEAEKMAAKEALEKCAR